MVANSKDFWIQFYFIIFLSFYAKNAKGKEGKSTQSVKSTQGFFPCWQNCKQKLM